ncbi:MAG: TMEM175 family protein [Methanoregula sp.]|nr:TMEM175 family protein [Methanoregula sp.]
MNEPTAEDNISWEKNRIEALTDGVFAFAMTLLVTSMILPHAADAPALTAAGALTLLIPNFIHYVIAFFVLAAFWTAHHLQFNQVRFISRPFLKLNIIGLFFVTLVPFTTSFVGDYPDTLASIVFELNLMALGLMMFMQWYYAAHNRRLISPQYPESKVRQGLYRNLVIPFLSLAGVILALAGSNESTAVYLLSPFASYAMSRHFARNQSGGEGEG